MAFPLIHSKLVYQGKAFDVRQDEVRTPKNQVMRLDIVAHSGAVTILPLDAQQRIWFVRQYRHAAGQELLELPAGTLEEGEAPEACARREIREEIGMAAGRIEKLGDFFLAPGYSTEFMHVFLATDLYPDPLEGDDDEFLSAVAFPAAQALHMAVTGEIKDAKSLAALALAGGRLGAPADGRR
jgi:ADP-ribose pyrophosphatase